MVTNLVIKIIEKIFKGKFGQFLAKLCRKYEEVIDYLFWGVLAFILSMVLYWIFVDLFHWIDWIANIIDWIICVLFTYATNRTFVFKSKVKGIKARFKEFTEFVSARLFTLGLEEIIIIIGGTVMGYKTGLGAMVVKFIGQVVVIVTNYILSKLWIFKEKKAPAEPENDVKKEEA